MAEERRGEPRGALAGPSNLLYDSLRVADRKASTLIGTLGIFLVAGLVVAALGVVAFLTLASHVKSGTTQSFDDAVIRWMGAHHSHSLDAVMLEVTALGTGTVVLIATLEAIQKFGIRRDPRILRDETPAPPKESVASSSHH